MISHQKYSIDYIEDNSDPDEKQIVAILQYAQKTNQKFSNKQNKQLLQRLFYVLKRYEQFFVQYHAFVITEDKIKFLREPTLSSQNYILTHGENEIQLHNKINDLKKYAQKILRRQQIFFKKKQPQICAVRIYNKYYLRINIVGFDLTVNDKIVQQNQTIQIPQNFSERLQLTKPKIIAHLDSIYEKHKESANPGINDLILVYEAYFKDVFEEVDKLVRIRQFAGEDRYLNKDPVFIRFQDQYQKKKIPLQAYYSCVQCIDHFKGYCKEWINEFQAQKKQGIMHRCDICDQYQYTISIDPIMDKIMKCIYNPKRKPIYYYPSVNRFKIFSENKKFFEYQNYYHFRDTIRALGNIKIRSELKLPPHEEFNLSMLIEQNKKFVIKDPCRGRFCNHTAFFDMRDLYASKKQMKYTCKICNGIIEQNEIIYLEEVQILLKLANKTIKKKRGIYDTFDYVKLYVDHINMTVKFKYKIHYSQKQDQEEIKRIYKTLIDPLYLYDQTELGLSDEQLEQMIEDYNWPKEYDLQSL